MNFDESFVYLLAGLTSTLAFAFAVKRLRMKPFDLREVFVEFSDVVFI